MKMCPACQAQYADDTLSFCLNDGTPLDIGAQPDAPTVVIGETETFVARSGQTGSHAWQPSEVTRVQSFEQPKKSSNTALIVALTAGGMLLLFGVIGIAAWMLLRDTDGPLVANTNTNLVKPTPNLNTNFNSSTPNANTPTRPSPSPSPDEPKPSPRPTVEEPRDLARYPSTTRLKFARGAYTTSFSGDINPGDNRSMVLACRAGQSLSASVSGGGGCISIRGGGSTYRTTTSGGDNYVTVTSRCSQTARFSISITII